MAAMSVFEDSVANSTCGEEHLQQLVPIIVPSQETIDVDRSNDIRKRQFSLDCCSI